MKSKIILSSALISLALSACTLYDGTEDGTNSSSSNGSSSSSLSSGALSSSSNGSINSLSSSSSSNTINSGLSSSSISNLDLSLSPTIELGGSANLTLPSYLDVDTPKTFSSSAADITTNAREIDLQFAPNGTEALFLTPSESSKPSIQSYSDQSIKIANLGAISISKYTSQTQIDQLYLSTPNKTTSVSAKTGDVLIVNSNQGNAALIQVTSVTATTAGIAKINVLQK